ncbi:cbb3-type cytochrome c oxidase subunit 3 [Pseudomonas seleniipraecipitans]|uniref:Cbb3-type cytochrome c oxidase subunit 3 n=1 Tax=Phytopseudomonas seleniipraecipitans TaxID=640205 RepID=A0ABY5JAV4_9GAMM|nr:cbb3-type cytochrome c oxidase subunit 3 [Pseudomonas seleniipraecipitans]UUD64760.1 cbb3-type cytochrome c oxidase subunit 3 [Pseudomonas seleniipraecipitans]
MLFDFIDIGMVRGFGTALVLIAFTCVTLWAYSGRRAKAFDEAANLPFADEQNKAAVRKDTP